MSSNNIKLMFTTSTTGHKTTQFSILKLKAVSRANGNKTNKRHMSF